MTEQKKYTFAKISALAKKSQKPLKDRMLENLQQEFFGDYPHPYYRFLYYLVLERQPKLALEIGVDQGIGSAHMAVAAASYGGHVVGIDKEDRHVLDGFDNFDFLQTDSTHSDWAISEKVKEYGRLGLIFQDASHEYEDVLSEWKIMRSHLDKDAIWVCDDVSEHIYPELVKYFKSRRGRKKFYDELHKGTVVGVSLL